MAGSNLQSAYLMSTLGAALLGEGASIINITSTASIHGNYGLYGTMKVGLEGLTRSLAVELAPFGVRVNAIAPGWIETANYRSHHRILALHQIDIPYEFR